MIAALGLEGALLKLRESTDENMAAFAKLIPNVRAISGALRETDDDGKRTADALQHLHEMTVAAFNEKYKLFIESDAQKTLAEMNKLKTFLTTDLGAAIVQAVNQFLGFAGGADAIGAAIKAMIPVRDDGRGGLRQLRRGNGRGGDQRAAGGLGAWSLGSGRQRLDGGAGGLCRLRLRQHPHHPEHPASGRGIPQGANGRAWMRSAPTNQQRIEEEDRANQVVVQRANQALAEQRKAYFKMVDETKADNKRLTDDSHATMNKIVEEAEKEVHVLRNLANEADRAITDSMKRSTEIAGTLADTQFRLYESQWKERLAAAGRLCRSCL